MEEYAKNLPVFIFWASAGIVVSLLFASQKTAFTKMRLVREVFGGFWVASVGYLLLDQLTELSDVVLYVISSLLAYVNSRIISMIGHDLMEAIAKGLGRMINNIADRFKKNADPYYDNENQ